MPDTAWRLPFSSWVAGWDWPSANILERRDLRTFTSDPFLSYARNSKLLAKIKSLKALRAQKILARRSRKSSKNGRWHDTAHSKTLMNRKVNGTVSHSSQLILWMAVEICEEFRGRSSIELSGTSTATEAAHRGAAGAWRNAFIAGGHRHDAFVRLGLVMETFETAITWDRFAAFHAAVMEATEAAAQRVCGRGMVSCRFSYVYPDGPAPYYTVLGQGRPGSELEQWAEIKAAASDALIAAGGTITHHHAVGRYHRPWYDQERPPLFAEAYQAIRRALDPAGIMNPGVLIDL